MSVHIITPYTKFLFSFFFDCPSTAEIYTLSLHDALPILDKMIEFLQERGATEVEEVRVREEQMHFSMPAQVRHLEPARSEEHTSELQSLRHLVCRLLLEKKKKKIKKKKIRLAQVQFCARS